MTENEGKLIMYGQLDRPPLIVILSKKKIIQQKIEKMTDKELEELEKILENHIANNLKEKK